MNNIRKYERQDGKKLGWAMVFGILGSLLTFGIAYLMFMMADQLYQGRTVFMTSGLVTLGYGLIGFIPILTIRKSPTKLKATCILISAGLVALPHLTANVNVIAGVLLLTSSLMVFSACKNREKNDTWFSEQ